ncbi:hypothetical protein GUITHDRAFT_139461 [Guillardia theta CCMP2712]|uniref:Right handed beta helix domain-containing protein n=1 Tax=Guillardia theta (strain CCMP2712) TaxID=905079 RepID=L1J9S0_GUITC|nr:hypothetical protein GUITHDRAFT_139461 [Guillardia theta CCMP2712]EKX44844.1 hypothetical protein GUITHDRAFT_139461 [Guillardia theta CCMP2712]|eukprot:XP_005831824.1 hypothetical protein GUITHDRAFT_139461 [Guillardia theta CCMP2712]
MRHGTSEGTNCMFLTICLWKKPSANQRMEVFCPLAPLNKVNIQANGQVTVKGNWILSNDVGGSFKGISFCCHEGDCLRIDRGRNAVMSTGGSASFHGCNIGRARCAVAACGKASVTIESSKVHSAHFAIGVGDSAALHVRGTQICSNRDTFSSLDKTQCSLTVTDCKIHENLCLWPDGHRPNKVCFERNSDDKGNSVDFSR